MKTKLHKLIGGLTLLIAFSSAHAQNTFPTNGNVGIGTTTPVTLGGLVVDQKVGFVHAVFGSNTTGVSIESNWPGIGLNSYYNLGRRYLSTGYANYFGANPADGSFYFQASSASGSKGAAATMKTPMTLSRAGAMTISGSDAGYIFQDRVQTNYSGFNWYANGGKARLYRYNFGGDLLTIDSLGRMGIGNNNPTLGGLVVDTRIGAVNAMFGSNANGVSIESNWPGISFNGYWNNGRKSIQTGYVSGMGMNPVTGLLTIYTSTASSAAGAASPAYDRVFINRYGYVGIGTEATAYPLEVCGTIRAKEILVQTGWCDYVFADDYKLRSLNDVAQYISENKHLPDVPAASAIESKGVAVAAMDSILIKKVEELTLYMIQQNKQIEQLQQKITQLQTTDIDKQDLK